MSDKAGGASQVLSLPKGGGALRGIGEKFSPDLHTGTGNFTVPIALPPGSQRFSTAAGPRLQHRKWQLSLRTRLDPGHSGGQPKTSKGVPRYQDETDVFILVFRKSCL